MFISETIDLLSRLDRACTEEFGGGLVFEHERKSRAIGHLMGGTEKEWPRSAAHLKGLLPKLKEAHVFLFEGIPMAVPEKGVGYILPRPDEEGLALFAAGGARPPFRICWFEYRIPGTKTVACLVEDRGEEIECTEFVRVDSARRPTLMMTCDSIACPVVPTAEGEFFSSRDGIRYRFVDPLGQLDAMTAMIMKTDRRFTAESALSMIAKDKLFFAYLSLVLQSHAKSMERVVPSRFGNRRLTDKGLSPHPEHHVVRLGGDWAPGPKPDLRFEPSGPNAEDLVKR